MRNGFILSLFVCLVCSMANTYFDFREESRNLLVSYQIDVYKQNRELERLIDDSEKTINAASVVLSREY